MWGNIKVSLDIAPHWSNPEGFHTPRSNCGYKRNPQPLGDAIYDCSMVFAAKADAWTG